MSGAVIGYNDVFSSSTTSVGASLVPTDGVSALERLKVAQLSTCAHFSGDFGAEPAFDPWESAPNAHFAFGSEGVSAQMFSLLDVRITGSVGVGLAVITDDANVYSVLNSSYYTSYPDGFVRHLHAIRTTPLQIVDVILYAWGVGTLSIGRVWASPLYTPPDQIEYDWVPRVVSAGINNRSKGQQAYPQARQCVRGLRMRFSHSEIATIIGTPGSTEMDPHQLAFVLDKQHVIAFPRTGIANDHLMHRFGVYGVSTRDQYEFPHRGGDRYDVEFDFLESL